MGIEGQQEQHQRTTASPTPKNKKAASATIAAEAETLICSAFDELEKERARRIELEAELKALQESALAPPSTPTKKSERKSRRRSSKASSSAPKEDPSLASIPPKHYTALQQELEGYRQIIDAMTQEKPAIAAALKAGSEKRLAIRTGLPVPLQNPTLPLHVIRLLEVMPWENKAQEHAFAEDELFEWQVYNLKRQKWCNSLGGFPSFFQALPTVRSANNSVQEYQPLDNMNMSGRDRSLLMFLAGCENMGKSDGSSSSLTAPPEKSVLTNAGLTQVMDMTKGFPLAHDGGTWQWVGGWRIEKRAIVFMDGRVARPQTLDCDEDGWSYAHDASDFLKANPEEHCFEGPGMVEDKLTLEKASFLSGNKVVRHVIPLRKVRRRKWTRRRVLVDYPHASEQSKHFLKLLAQNASLAYAANKISDQLVETKMKLTDTQLKTHQNEEDTKLKVAQLMQEIMVKEDVIAKLRQKKVEQKNSSQLPKTTKASFPETKEEKKPKELHHEEEVLVKKKSTADAVEVSKDPQKQISQQGNDLRGLVSQWVSSTHSKVKVISNEDEANSSNSENPVSEEDASAASFVVPEDDESLPEQSMEVPDQSGVNNDESANSFSRRNSTSSTNSQISFDWKKIGRDTIEKIKFLNPAVKDAQDSQPRSRSTSPTHESSDASVTESTLESDAEGSPVQATSWSRNGAILR